MKITSAEELAAGINAYVASESNVTLSMIRRKFNTSLQRIESLHKSGLIKTLPKKLDSRAGGKMGATVGGWRKGWC
jgi:hypothetical protein